MSAPFDEYDRRMKGAIANAKGVEGALASSATKGEQALQRIGRAAKVVAVGGIAALGVAAVDSVKSFDKFQSSMEMIHTQAGSTQQEVDRLSKSVLALAQSGKVSQGPQELSQGLFHLESIGLRGSAAMNALKIAAEGAAVGNANLEDTTTALGSAWLVNIKGAGNLRNVMGLLNATVGAGNVRMGDLVQALGTGILPAAKEAGLSIKDVFGAMAVFTDEGYQASSAAAQFSTALHFLYAPTTKAAGAMESIGLKSTSLAADMHKPNGLLVALRDLKGHLDATFPPSGGHALTVDQQTAALNRFKQGLESSGVSGKKLADAVDGYKGKLKDMGTAEIAQEQMLGQILPGGRGRIILTLLNQLDRYQMKLKTIGAGVANFGEDVRKTQETNAFKIKAAWSTIEAEMIKLGGHVAPFVADEFSKIAGVISHLDQNGTFNHIFSSVGHDISGLSQLLPTVELAFHAIGATIGFTAHEVSGLINAFGGIGVVAPALLGAYAAVKTFQIGVAVLGPAVRDAAFAFSLMRDAIAGGELAALPGLLVGAINPATALTIAVAGLGAGIAILATRESYETQIAKEEAQAKRDQANATRDLSSAEDKGAHSVLDAQQAHLSLAQAVTALTDAKRKYGTGSTQYRQALLNEKQAALSWHDAHKQMESDLNKLDNTQRNSTIKTTDDYEKALRRVDDAQRKVNDSMKTGAGHADPKLLKQLAEAQKELADVTSRGQQVDDRAAISAVNYQRALAGVSPIADKNKAAVAALTGVLNRIPAAKRTKLEADNQDALAKIGQVVPRLIAYGQMQKAAKILANADNANQALRQVLALLASLHDKNINVTTTTTQRYVQVGNPTSTQTPGHHAKGTKTDGPEIAVIGEDSPRFAEWVIPENPAYRGRAMELLMDAMHSILPGFKAGTKKGKPVAKKHRPIPPARDPISLPLDTFQQGENKAKSQFDSANQKVQQDDRQIKSIEKRVNTTTKGKAAEQARANARKELAAVKASRAHDRSVLADARKNLRLRKQELSDAQKFADAIKKQEDLVEIARNAMDLADKKDDQKGYDAAKTRRGTALDALKGLYNEALHHIKPGTEYARSIEIALGTTLNDIQDLSTTFNQPETVAAQPELTPDQQSQLDALQKAIALDEIRTPYDLGIEQTDVQNLVNFRESVLAGLQATGAPDDLITQAAQDVKSARDELDQLSSSGGTSGNNPDLQAQLDQANARVAAATLDASISSKALEVFQGAGDLGFGSPQIVQNNYMLHPSDPDVLAEVGRAATAGIDYRTSGTAPRTSLGV